jgi:homoserine O-acetyltransferase
LDDEIAALYAERGKDPNSVGIVETQYWTCQDEPLDLECGRRLTPYTLAYETYGELSPQRDNVILIFHALSGDAHVAGYHTPTDTKPGWWDLMIGPGKPMDTNRYFVICANVLAGCKGSTGPSSINPETGRPYGLSFPLVTIGDMVRAQERLLSHLGIERLLAVVGASMGGMQALEFVVQFPERVASVLAIATAARMSTQGIAFDAIARHAIMSDPNWRQGDYYGGQPPASGLSIARMIGHITYLSEEQMTTKFGRRLQSRESYGYDMAVEFQVESYLDHQGNSFVQRFDPNSYLYITKAIDYFDLAAGRHSLVEAFSGVTAEFLVVSFTSDWLFPTHQSKELVRALQANGVRTTFLEITSDYGHDTFLLPNPELGSAVSAFLGQVAAREWAATRREDA